MATTDRVKPGILETVSSTGAGTATLAGAVAGFTTFLLGLGSGATALYCMANADRSKIEIGFGTVGAGTLTRNYLWSSTGALISWTAGDVSAGIQVTCDWAWALNSMLRWHFASSRAAWLPSMTVWIKDAGSNNVEFYLYDGTSDRLFLTINTSTGAITYVNVAVLGATNTFTALQEIVLTSPGNPAFRVISTDGSAGAGPGIDLYRQSPTPAGFDLGPYVNFVMRTSVAPNDETVASILSWLTGSVGAGTEYGGLDFNVLVNGTLQTLLKLQNGAVFGTPTGAEKGVGTINAQALYKNNVEPLYDTDAIALVEERQSSGTDGGTFTSGSWQKRTLNTEVTDTDALVSLSSGVIALVAGTYEAEFLAVAYECNEHQCRLRNTSDGTTAGIGTAARSASTTDASGVSSGKCRFTIGSTKNFELQHRCAATRPTDGLGKAANFDEQNVYSRVLIRKIAA